MLSILIRLAVYFQSIYRWNLEREKPRGSKEHPVDNINTSILIWALLLMVSLLLWMTGIVFTPCDWITEGGNELTGYFIVAFGSSVLLSTVITASLFLWSSRLKKALSEVNSRAEKVNVTNIYWQIPLFMFLYIAYLSALITYSRYSCGLSIINENGFW